MIVAKCTRKTCMHHSVVWATNCCIGKLRPFTSCEFFMPKHKEKDMNKIKIEDLRIGQTVFINNESAKIISLYSSGNSVSLGALGCVKVSELSLTEPVKPIRFYERYGNNFFYSDCGRMFNSTNARLRFNQESKMLKLGRWMDVNTETNEIMARSWDK